MRLRLAALVTALAASALLLAGCSAPGGAPDAVSCAYPSSGGAAAREVSAPPTDPTVSGAVSVVLETSAGDIPMELDADRVPCAVGSFVSLTEQGYYDDTPCHRLTVAEIFVLQCGDPSGTGSGGPGYRYADELDGSETYPAGTVAMANAGADTNGSQFFLVYEDSGLPPAYTVLGELAPEGLEVVREIAAGGTGGNGIAPATPVTITAVTLD